MPLHGDGPAPARIMIVGEAPGQNEIDQGKCFVGASGQELNRMLHEAGLMRSECYVTNVCRERPYNNYVLAWFAQRKNQITEKHLHIKGRYCLPVVKAGLDALEVEISMVQPQIIIAFGNVAMWALTGEWGILKWRGSQLTSSHGIKVIPTVHPAGVLRDWPMRRVVVRDLQRVKDNLYPGPWQGVPEWKFLIRPSFAQTLAYLNRIDLMLAESETWIDFDIETQSGHIDCIGLGISHTEGICIPFVELGRHYWHLDEEEGLIVWRLYKILTHKNAKVRWQNGLYDAQYVYRHWHFIPNGVQDTMIAQHSCFAASPKSLSYLASMYAPHYVYWKEEGKLAKGATYEERWRYNCQDLVYTRIVGEVLEETAKQLGLAEVDAGQQRMFYPALSAMIRGVAISTTAKNQMVLDIQEELSHRKTFLVEVLGHDINPRSSKQMCQLFYEDLKQPTILKKTIKEGQSYVAPTCDDEALETIGTRQPLLRPICHAIADIRTLEKLLGDFVLMPLDVDGRMRCSFNVAGDAGGKSAPYSYRLSSSKNAFDTGGNLQTIPSEKSKSIGKAKARGSMDFELPNVREMYIPDPGFTFFDGDLDRADLQVVVWEAGDELLKIAMAKGVDTHLLNVYTLDGQDPPPLEELVEGHPKYPDHRGPRKYKREFSKVFCHATNYVGGAKTVASHTGRTVHEIDRAQHIWFSAHPGIKEMHKRVEEQVTKYGFVENKFGFRWYIMDRLSGILPEAVAWIPQCVPLDHEVLTPRGWKKIENIQENDKIAIWNPSGEVFFEVPARWNYGEADRLVYLSGLGYYCTEEHRLPYKTGDNATIRTVKANALKDHYRIPRVGYYKEGTCALSSDQVIFLAALQADGHYDNKRDSITFEFQKERKITRLENALNSLGIGFTKALVRRGATTFYISKEQHGVTSLFKTFGPWLLKLTAESLDLLLIELEYWDGWRSDQGELWFSSSLLKNCEWIATIGALRGKRVRWMSADTRSERPNYRITIAPNKGKFSAHVKTTSERRGSVACPTVSTGFFLLRYNNEISVTGNSTVGIVINKIWSNFHYQLPEVQVLLQVHDSLAGQIPNHRVYDLIPKMKELAKIVVPYDDPLIIPFGLSFSTKSWGDCK